MRAVDGPGASRGGGDRSYNHPSEKKEETDLLSYFLSEMDPTIMNTTTETGMQVCYAPKMIQSNGIWLGDKPLSFSFPLFLLQMIIIVSLSRILHFLLKPFRQPRVVSEILGGILLGPSVMGRSEKFSKTVFPLRSLAVLETMANLGLLYFLFLIGVEMGLSLILRTGKKVIFIALGGLVFSFIIGAIVSLFMHDNTPILDQSSYVIFVAVSLSVTAFPVLARILAEIKLINKDIGKLAIAVAIINDMFAWIPLAFATSRAQRQALVLNSVWLILASTGLVVLCIFLVRPAIRWLIRNTPEGESFNELSVSVILGGVMISGLISDAIGAHPALGAFIYGLVIPSGPLGFSLIEKLEDFISAILLPLFFANNGLKTKITEIVGVYSWAVLFAIIVVATLARIGGTVLVTHFYEMPIREGITLGFLLNTKGLIMMIILNAAKEHRVVDERTFAMMIIIALAMTAVVTPFVTIIYKSANATHKYTRRAIQTTMLDTELKILVCVHTPRNVPTIIKLLEASHPTDLSPISVHVLHLVELTGRASTMLIVHDARETGHSAVNKMQAQADQIVMEFKNFEKLNGSITLETNTVISSYSTMHEDICNLAENNQVTIIIIPFHKHQTVDGGMATMFPEIQLVNQKVLLHKSCSIGILVDRGLSLSRNIIVLFFGGPDDREALCYALRMAEHPQNSLTVIRFLPGDQTVEPTSENFIQERQLDDECISDFMAAANSEYVYTENVVNNGVETVAELRSIKSFHDLFIIGKRDGIVSPLTAGINDWSECPELGAIGDLLASSDFSTTISVLVVQQSVALLEEEIKIPVPSS